MYFAALQNDVQLVFDFFPCMFFLYKIGTIILTSQQVFNKGRLKRLSTFLSRGHTIRSTPPTYSCTIVFLGYTNTTTTYCCGYSEYHLHALKLVLQSYLLGLVEMWLQRVLIYRSRFHDLCFLSKNKSSNISVVC